jgi:hypothetical protein
MVSESSLFPRQRWQLQYLADYQNEEEEAGNRSPARRQIRQLERDPSDVTTAEITFALSFIWIKPGAQC